MGLPTPCVAGRCGHAVSNTSASEWLSVRQGESDFFLTAGLRTHFKIIEGVIARGDDSKRRQRVKSYRAGRRPLQRLRRLRTLCGSTKNSEIRTTVSGEPIQDVDGRVFLSPLKTTNVGSILASNASRS